MTNTVGIFRHDNPVFTVEPMFDKYDNAEIDDFSLTVKEDTHTMDVMLYGLKPKDLEELTVVIARALHNAPAQPQEAQ